MNEHVQPLVTCPTGHSITSLLARKLVTFSSRAARPEADRSTTRAAHASQHASLPATRSPTIGQVRPYPAPPMRRPDTTLASTSAAHRCCGGRQRTVLDVPGRAITPRTVCAASAPSLPSGGRLRITGASLAADPPPMLEEDVVGATQTIAPCSHVQHTRLHGTRDDLIARKPCTLVRMPPSGLRRWLSMW